MLEFVKATGKVSIKLYGPDGKLKQSEESANTVVTAGKNYLAAWLDDSSQSTPFMSYIAIGTGTTAPTVGDTALQTEVVRKQGVLSSATNVWQNTVTFGNGEGSGAITETGLFSEASAGTMFARKTFSAINKASADNLVITWQVTFA